MSDQQFFDMLVVKNTDPTCEQTDALYWAAHCGNILLILTSNSTYLYFEVFWLWLCVLMHPRSSTIVYLFYPYVYNTWHNTWQEYIWFSQALPSTFILMVYCYNNDKGNQVLIVSWIDNQLDTLIEFWRWDSFEGETCFPRLGSGSQPLCSAQISAILRYSVFLNLMTKTGSSFDSLDWFRPS